MTTLKRARPFAGTFLNVEIESQQLLLPNFLTRVFESAAHWESKLSPVHANSLIRHFATAEVPAELREASEFCRELRDLSQGAFDPFRTGLPAWDPGGWAKGWILDRLAEEILAADPLARGSLNAGGDVRFLSEGTNEVTLRLGSLAKPVSRTFDVPVRAVATSATNVAEQDPRSSTRYSRERRAGLSADHAVVALADSGLVADAMTKVGLFAEVSVISECGRKFQARVLVFDPEGNLAQVFPS